MTYTVNEMFLSLQGEGLRAGTVNVFVRFTGCNQTCKVETHGFDCDTEFASGVKMSAEDIKERIVELGGNDVAVIFTGGEPGLQVDAELINVLGNHYLAIETNGSIELPSGFDWITVSPKVAEHAIRQQRADEVKYVRNVGQGIPKPTCVADHKLISPATQDGRLDMVSLSHCIELVKQNPTWRLSVQQHKTWMVR